MGRTKKALSVFLALLLCILVGCGQKTVITEEEQQPVTYENAVNTWKQKAKTDTVTCWYTSDADKSYLEQAAQAFQKEYNIKVNPVYYDGINLFEDMNQANQKGNGPDVYLMGNDQLEYAKASGMAEENTTYDAAFWKENYPDVAKNALTYKDKQYGYPIYFDTYCLVYDANLLENAPASIDEILAFLDEYEDTGSTKAVFRWDVADPYVNTMFYASYANLFGENGDDTASFQVNNDQCVAAMQYFQSLSAYLWMDKSNISHDTIMNRIKDGTLVLGLCKSDILPTLYELQGQNETNYQISYVPSLTAELSSTAWSTTYGAFVNPYGKDVAAGNLFAMYLSYGYQDRQYAGNGKLPVRNQGEGFDAMQTVLYAQYLNSTPVPKVMVLGDYLVDSGIAFDAIWDGQDAKEKLDWLQNTMTEKIK